jgi:Na+/melibiose symporter-like transporter
MAEGQKIAPQGLLASVTTVLGTFATASCLHWLPPEHAQYSVVATTLFVPVISYLIVRFFSSIDEPEELTRYKARLNRDLAHQKKILKDKDVPQAVKESVREKYANTMLKLSTANQDYTEQGLVITG